MIVLRMTIAPPGIRALPVKWPSKVALGWKPSTGEKWKRMPPPHVVQNIPGGPGSYNRFSMPPATETRLRVRYAETDQMGVVYYANHFVWMEVGRVDLCKACGFNYRDMERGRRHIPRRGRGQLPL